MSLLASSSQTSDCTFDLQKLYKETEFYVDWGDFSIRAFVVYFHTLVEFLNVLFCECNKDS